MSFIGALATRIGQLACSHGQHDWREETSAYSSISTGHHSIGQLKCRRCDAVAYRVPEEEAL